MTARYELKGVSRYLRRSFSATDLATLAAAVSVPLGVFEHEGCRYLHNPAERYVVDVTHGGVVLYGPEYRAIFAAAFCGLEEAAISIAGLTLRSEPEPDPREYAERVKARDMETVTGRKKVVLGGDDIPDLPFLEGREIIGVDSTEAVRNTVRADRIEGWE